MRSGIHLFRPFTEILSVALFAALVRPVVATAASNLGGTPPPPAAPLRIENAPAIDLTRTDGGLPPVIGVENFGVFRASHARPDLAERKGYTYNHHPDMAVWRGRFYVAWDSGAKDEDTWPARELYSTSINGRDWSAPAELFPEGLSTPLRLYFFHAPNGRMLAFAGLRLDHAKTDEDTKGPLVVREIREDHSLAPTFTLRAPEAGLRPGDPPLFETSTDRGFVEACRQLLDARITLETQDLGVLLDPSRRMRWHDPKAWPNGKVGSGFWKAPSFYHRSDGAIVGIGKAGWTSVTADHGLTWSVPVVPPTLVTNNAKVWGQQTGDGRYALVYNPTRRPRYPLAIVTSDDGVTFGDMRVVQSRFTAQRYPGLNKNTGLQYVRGIAEWASDGSIVDAQRALWLVYSANKEDIWASRVDLSTASATTTAWSTYSPKWSSVVPEGNQAVTLETHEPFDCAEATRFFAPRPQVNLELTITTPPTGFGAVDVALGSTTGTRPVRLRFAGDGMLRAYDRDKMVEFGRFAPRTAVSLRIETKCGKPGEFELWIDGKPAGKAQFTEAASMLNNVTIRVWAKADADRPPEFRPATAIIGREFDEPAGTVACDVTGLKIN